ncbi:MAG: DUF11 domain-containing protein, partial [Gemmatimonadota bacterium]|nr:DUF11 domain-containing protein [Gemmatimonadota bacterium]
TRTYEWDIDKRVLNAPTDPLAQGEVYILQYEVEPIVTGSQDSGHSVSGQITITNLGEAASPFIATISDVTDVLSAGGLVVNANVTSCNPMLPADIGGGASVVCDYSVTDAGLAAADMWTNTASVTATWNDGSDGSGTGMADADFGDPSSVLDECVEVSDTHQGGVIDTVCQDDVDKTFEYTLQLNGDGGDLFLVCGPNSIDNTASFVTNDNALTGNDMVTVNIDVVCDVGCTLTQGYWKTHSDQGPAPYDMEGWGNLGDYDGDGEEEEEGESLVGTNGPTFHEIFWTPVRGRPWYNVAHQYMAAYLNVQNGADPTALGTALTDASAWLESADPEARNRDLSPADRQLVQGWISLFSDYNEGIIGPGHCAEDFTSEN